MARTLSETKRSGYLSAALRLFVRQGMLNTSTAEIAREAGTAVGTLFLYFPTKLDLIHALVLKISQEQAAFVSARLAHEQPVRDTFFAIWEGSLRWFIENPDAYRYVQQVRDSGLLTEEVVQQTAKDLAYYGQAIQKGWSEGRIQRFPPELIGGVLYQDVVAVMNLIQADPSRQEEYIRLGFAIFWNGIRAGGEVASETGHS